MKKFGIKRLLILVFLLFLIAVLPISGVFSAIGASADYFYDNSDFGEHAFYYEQFHVEYDIKSNREMDVCERLTVKYNGASNTGFMRDIPVNGGEQVRNVSVTEFKGGEETSVAYDVYTDQADDGTDFITVDIGDYTQKRGTTHTYVLRYTYCLTKAQEGADNLALNVIGVQQRRVENASATLILPDGFKSGNYIAGRLGSTYKTPVTAQTVNGRTVIEIDDISLAFNECLTFDLAFESGALNVYFDFTPFWFVIGGAVLLLIILAVKFLAFNKQTLTPVVNFEAPDNMNPLLMGKLIDNTVNNEDITSMIFYWADKEYLKINLDDKEDPTLIRIVKRLPENAPAYEQELFNGLFQNGETVKPSMLKNRFYKVVERVKVRLNTSVNGLYSRPSVILSAVLAILGGLLTCVAPIIIAATQVSSKFIPLFQFIALLPMVFIFILAQGVKYNFIKSDKKLITVYSLIIIGLVLFTAIMFGLTVSGAVINIWAKITLVLIACANVICSVLIVERTPQYTSALNEILGFRNFIKLAEKDRLEKMIEDNPQFYYHILPYAQVLGVSDVWEEKFANITVEPPRWATSSSLQTVFELHMFNSIMRNAAVNMTRNMTSRPSSSGGGGFGGFSGGHGGGGHGGGGSRGR